MSNPDLIAFCSMEVAPFSKVGGLGDVAGSLPKALHENGLPIVVITALHGTLKNQVAQWKKRPKAIEIQVQETPVSFNIYETTLPNSSVPVYFLDHADWFGQYGQVYPHLNIDEEILRYEGFSLAALELTYQLISEKAPPEPLDTPSVVVHVNDWHTAPMATMIKTNPRYAGFRSVLTIHSMAYQGQTDTRNLLKEGIEHCDALTTVSPTYAQEITTPEFGEGLETTILACQSKLKGILNGIDMDAFNPASDPRLPATYNSETVAEGKQASKKALAQRYGLPETVVNNSCWLGMVSRLVEQKGLDILIEALPQLAQCPVQVVIVGTGQEEYESALEQAAQQWDNITVDILFDLALGQQVYAASDAFLMPSRFEPCGLGQLIALRYGALPIVRQVGGLSDTVVDPKTSKADANGFVFKPYTASDLLETIQRALALNTSSPDVWQAMVKRGMNQDWSWSNSARHYAAVYNSLLQPRPTVMT